MSLLDREFSRRKLLQSIPRVALGLGVYAAIGCAPNQDETTDSRPEFKTIENEQDIIEAVLKLGELHSVLQPIAIDQVPEITTAEQYDSLPNLLPDPTGSPANKGIEKVAFALNTNTNNLAIYLKLTESVGYGSSFRKSPTPIPAFLVLFRENESATALRFVSAETFSVEAKDKKSTFEKMAIEFYTTPKALSDLEFIVLFNSKLLRVDNQDVPYFFLPYRFHVQSAEPIA